MTLVKCERHVYSCGCREELMVTYDEEGTVEGEEVLKRSSCETLMRLQARLDAQEKEARTSLATYGLDSLVYRHAVRKAEKIFGEIEVHDDALTPEYVEEVERPGPIA
jgi:hypothetical protein